MAVSGRWLVVAVIALAGCDRVFWLQPRDALCSGTVISVVGPDLVTVDQTVMITATLEGPPGSAVTWSRPDQG